MYDLGECIIVRALTYAIASCCIFVFSSVNETRGSLLYKQASKKIGFAIGLGAVSFAGLLALLISKKGRRSFSYLFKNKGKRRPELVLKSLPAVLGGIGCVAAIAGACVYGLKVAKAELARVQRLNDDFMHITRANFTDMKGALRFLREHHSPLFRLSHEHNIQLHKRLFSHPMYSNNTGGGFAFCFADESCCTYRGSRELQLFCLKRILRSRVMIDLLEEYKKADRPNAYSLSVYSLARFMDDIQIPYFSRHLFILVFEQALRDNNDAQALPAYPLISENVLYSPGLGSHQEDLKSAYIFYLYLKRLFRSLATIQERQSAHSVVPRCNRGTPKEQVLGDDRLLFLIGSFL